jgi:hypothetical protein
VHVHAEGVVAPGHVLEVALHAVVVLGVDDPLVLPGAPRMRARGGEERVTVGGELEQAGPCLALARDRVGQVLAAPRADLDLRLDQLAGHGLGQDLVLGRGGLQLGKAMFEGHRPRIEDRELLLDPDREVAGGLEHLPDAAHVQHAGGPQVR